MNNEANSPDRSVPQPWPVQNGPRSALVGRISLGVLATLALVFLAVFWQTVISILIGVAGAVVGAIVLICGGPTRETNEHRAGWRDGPMGYGEYDSDGGLIMDIDGEDSTYK